MLKAEYEKTYALYAKLPKFVLITLLIITFILGFVLVSIDGDDEFLVIWPIGAIASCILYFLTKLAVAINVMKIELLKEISSNTASLKSDSTQEPTAPSLEDATKAVVSPAENN